MEEAELGEGFGEGQGEELEEDDGAEEGEVLAEVLEEVDVFAEVGEARVQRVTIVISQREQEVGNIIHDVLRDDVQEFRKVGWKLAVNKNIEVYRLKYFEEDEGLRNRQHKHQGGHCSYRGLDARSSCVERSIEPSDH